MVGGRGAAFLVISPGITLMKKTLFVLMILAGTVSAACSLGYVENTNGDCVNRWSYYWGILTGQQLSAVNPPACGGGLPAGLPQSSYPCGMPCGPPCSTTTSLPTTGKPCNVDGDCSIGFTCVPPYYMSIVNQEYRGNCVPTNVKCPANTRFDIDRNICVLDPQACTYDSDCVFFSPTCCPCTPSGLNQITVNKDALPELLQRRSINCSNAICPAIACMPNTAKTPACISGRCSVKINQEQNTTLVPTCATGTMYIPLFGKCVEYKPVDHSSCGFWSELFGTCHNCQTGTVYDVTHDVCLVAEVTSTTIAPTQCANGQVLSGGKCISRLKSWLPWWPA